jgi:hypothetical protein
VASSAWSSIAAVASISRCQRPPNQSPAHNPPAATKIQQRQNLDGLINEYTQAAQPEPAFMSPTPGRLNLHPHPRVL